MGPLWNFISDTLINGFMLIKVDLEKAYDRLSWDFIKDILIKVGFPDSWTINIMHIEIVKMSILWNGYKLEGFKPPRGIRQGDAISP